MKNVKVSSADLLLEQVGGTGEPTEESADSSTQVVHSSNVCLVHKQMFHAQKLKFYENEVHIYLFQNIHIFIQGFLSHVSELRRLDKFLISCDVVPL